MSGEFDLVGQSEVFDLAFEVGSEGAFADDLDLPLGELVVDLCECELPSADITFLDVRPERCGPLSAHVELTAASHTGPRASSLFKARMVVRRL